MVHFSVKRLKLKQNEAARLSVDFCFPISQECAGWTSVVLLELWKIEDNLVESKIKPRPDQHTGQSPCCILPLGTNRLETLKIPVLRELTSSALMGLE